MPGNESGKLKKEGLGDENTVRVVAFDCCTMYCTILYCTSYSTRLVQFVRAEIPYSTCHPSILDGRDRMVRLLERDNRVSMPAPVPVNARCRPKWKHGKGTLSKVDYHSNSEGYLNNG